MKHAFNAVIISALLLVSLTFVPHEASVDMYRWKDSRTNDYLDYWLRIPDIECDTLIVFLHGDGEVNNPYGLKNYGIAHQAKEIYGNSHPFVLLMPCTRTYSWVKGTIPETLIHLIRYTAAKYNCHNVVITGHSRGAIGAWYMAAEYPNDFCCCMPISCSAEESDPTKVQCPVLVREADHDYSSKADVQALREAGGRAKITIHYGATHGGMARGGYDEASFNWMLRWKNTFEPPYVEFKECTENILTDS